MKDYNAISCLNLALATIESCFENRHKDQYNYKTELAFLESDFTQAACDCSNLLQEKIIKQFKTLCDESKYIN